MEIPFPWEQLTGEPLVYASMGTLHNGNVDVFRTIAAALSKHKGRQLVLSIGNLLSRNEIANRCRCSNFLYKASLHRNR